MEIEHVVSFYPMSLLFHKKTRTVIKWVWGVIAVLIALSMVLAYSGGIGGTS